MQTSLKRFILLFFFNFYITIFLIGQTELKAVAQITASSTIGTRYPSYVQDQEIIPSQQFNYWQSNTNINQWITIPLLKEYIITKVELYDLNTNNLGTFNQNCYVAGASNINDFDNFTLPTECSNFQKVANFSENISSTLVINNFKAKYLRIWDADGGGIRLTEIKIFGREINTTTPNSNNNNPQTNVTPNSQSANANTPIDVQIKNAISQKNNSSLTKLLNENSSSFTQQNVDDAFINGQVEQGKKIVLATSIKPSQNALNTLMSNGKTAIVQDLLNNTIIEGNTALLNIALKNNQSSLVSYLSKRVKPNSETYVLIANENNTDLFQELIDNDNKITNNAAINIAIDKGNTEIVNIALNNGGNATEALTYAINKDKMDLVKIIVTKKGVDASKAFTYAISKNNNQLFSDLLKVPNVNIQTALDEAMKAKNMELAELAVETNKTKPTKYINTVIKIGNDVLVKKMVTNGGDPSIGMDTAINNHKTELVEFFITNGASATPAKYLELSAGLGHLDITRLLVESGGNASNGIANAVAFNKTEIVEYLLSKKADANLGMVKAGENGQLPMLKLLIESGGTPTKAVLTSVTKNHPDALKYLIENGADITDSKLMLLAINNNMDGVVKILLDNNYDIKSVDYASKAIFTNNKSIFNMLIAKGAKVTETNALTIAAGNGNIEIVKYLVENKFMAQDGVLPAIQKNKAEVLKYLVDNGAKANDDKYVLTAINSKASSVIDILVASGADFKKVDGLGNTYLHNAALLNDVPMVDALIKAGVPLDAQNFKGNTVLHIAADMTDRVPIIMLLAKAGANLNIKNNNRNTPKEVAPSGSKSRKALKDLNAE